ncbi:hypothetical protein M419DRAFT_116954 [Trichoderma reesei RUT C-30]|jgi:hypothetical protein|uniref:Uncharacterized protein n=1 Tax=Hypocrea jecorina (strain ATCC 56765 / BCRC 32924 / NRRL 11460 / Rut C-30) TaxID=1344414 RepID=A0A024SJM5_HYPJR|nr:hypothetical protein M419DRAFT_116954 [Trichoderma reesei RUT C-30]
MEEERIATTTTTTTKYKHRLMYIGMDGWMGGWKLNKVRRAPNIKLYVTIYIYTPP